MNFSWIVNAPLGVEVVQVRLTSDTCSRFRVKSWNATNVDSPYRLPLDASFQQGCAVWQRIYKHPPKQLPLYSDLRDHFDQLDVSSLKIVILDGGGHTFKKIIEQRSLV